MNLMLLLSNPKRGIRFLHSVFYGWLAGIYMAKSQKAFDKSQKILAIEKEPVQPEEVFTDALFQREIAISSLIDNHIQMVFYIIPSEETKYDDEGKAIIPLYFNIAYMPPKTFQQDLKYKPDRLIVLRKDVREVKEFIVDVLQNKEKQDDI